MKIKVTKNHINRGKIANHGYCPIALAIRDMYKGREGIYIDEIDISRRDVRLKVKDKGDHYVSLYLLLPEKAQKFIYNFDEDDGRKRKPEPFEFELNGLLP